MRLASAPFFDGMTFYYPLEEAQDYCVAGPNDVMGFEPGITAYLRNVLRNDMLFLDIGAANGYYTLLAANLAWKVIAFEPKVAERSVLLENIRRNGLENVAVIDSPLFSRVARGSIRKCRFRPCPDGEYVTATLDSLGLSPDVVKIDVEGAELDVLMGAKETLRLHRPVVVMEIHKHKIKTFGYAWTQVSDFLQERGYTVTRLGQRRLARFIKAEFEG